MLPFFATSQWVETRHSEPLGSDDRANHGGTAKRTVQEKPTCNDSKCEHGFIKVLGKKKIVRTGKGIVKKITKGNKMLYEAHELQKIRKTKNVVSNFINSKLSHLS
jgi:hypothetical protein